MRRTIVRLVVLLATAATTALWPRTACGQSETAEAVFQSQAVILQRLFADLDAGPRDRQRLDLWLADLLLTPGQGPMGAAGLEEAVVGGALASLQRLAQDPDADLAALARAVESRIRSELDVDRVAGGPTLAPAATDTFGADQWVTLAAEPAVEYRFDAGACPVVRAVAVAADGRRAIAGGTFFENRFTFLTDRAETIHVRIRTPLCGGAQAITVSARPPATPLRASAPRTAPERVAEGRRYVGLLDAERWFLVDVRGERRYTFSATPEDTRLDPYVTLFSANGSVELGADDDSGGGLAARLEYVPREDATLLLRVHPLNSAPGTFDFTVTSRPPLLEVARPIEAGGEARGSLAPRGDEWWRLDATAGQTYVFETRPADDLDTVIELHRAPGDDEVAFDDDSGDGLGSRLEWTSRQDDVLLLRVRAYGDVGGGYALTVTARAAAPMVPVAVDQPRSATLAAGAEHWFEVRVERGWEYVFSAVPDGSLDTYLTLYDESGVTEIDSDDDGGGGLGSRLVHDGTEDARLLVRLHGLGGTSGPYRFTVTRTPRP
jgi:hypothetical protein